MPDSESIAEYQRQMQRLAEAVRVAGEVALKTFRAPLKSWTKGKDSPVCEADVAVNELLHERLAGDGFGWLSEESPDDPQRLEARQVWVIDPIDGTRAYIAGLVDWTIATALVEDGRPVAAALYAPVTEELFTATAGGGSFCNGIRMSASAGDTLADAQLNGPRKLIEALQKTEAGIIAAPRIHSLALRFARVAQGALDAGFASRNSHDWDLAAADLLVHEAGGLLTTLAGQVLIYNQAVPTHDALVAAGRARHRRFMEIARKQRMAMT